MFIWLLKRLITILISPYITLRSIFFNKPSFKYSEPFKSVDFSIMMDRIDDQYSTRFVLPKSVLEDLIHELKSEKYHRIFKDFNIKNPFVNYVVLYETRTLSELDANKSIYANHWHTDDSLDVGSLKIFQLPKTISPSEGPMEFINKENTKLNWKKFFFRGRFLSYKSQIFNYTQSNKALFLDARSCMHKAGVPENDNKRTMLMLQIIDRKKNENIDELYNKQYHKEPTALKRLFI